MTTHGAKLVEVMKSSILLSFDDYLSRVQRLIVARVGRENKCHKTGDIGVFEIAPSPLSGEIKMKVKRSLKVVINILLFSIFLQ